MNLKQATKKTKRFLLLLSELYQRWLDEQGYEDINEYLEVIKKVEPRAVAMSEEPFGVKVNVEGKIILFFIELQGDNIVIGTKE